MKFFKKCSQLRTVLLVILIISIISQCIIAYAETDSGGYGSDLTGMPEVSDGSYGVVSGEGWLVSIQEVSNTAYGSSDYSECDTTVASAFLYNFPECYVYDVYNNASKYAFIGNSATSKTTSYYVANPYPSGRSKSAVNKYRVDDKNHVSWDFKEKANILESSDFYETILEGLQSYSLTADYVIAAANSSGKLDSAITAYVNMWYDSASVDYIVNNFVYGTDTAYNGKYAEDLTFYQKAVRYLDLLIIVNAMCDNAWTDYIQDYLDCLNRDGSSDFIAIVVAAVANCAISNSNNKALMTLPVYYTYATDKSKGVTYFMSDPLGSEAGYDSDTETNFSKVQDSLNSADLGRGKVSKMTKNNTNSIWWEEGGGYATSVVPVGLTGVACGYCGYTYIAPSPGASVTEVVPQTESFTPVFNVEVSTDQYMVRSDTLVDTTVTIDMSQSSSILKKFAEIYSSDEIKNGDYTTAIEILVDRTFDNDEANDTTGAVMDLNGYM